MPGSISTEDLRRELGSARLRLVDARPVDAYNGWRLAAEPRGGHLPGAHSLPASWSQQENWRQLLQERDIRPEHRVVVYGYRREQAEEVAGQLAAGGFSEVMIYDGFCGEWSADQRLPLERLPGYRKLVPPQWLQRLLAGERPEAAPEGDWVLCHCHYRNPADYAAGHIPGALALDTRELESPDTWNRRLPEELERALCALGIGADTTVIVYGRFSSPSASDPHPGAKAGHLGSFRCAVLMLYAGVRDVRVLNGGLAAWGAADLPLAREPEQPRPRDSFGAEIPARADIYVDTAEAKQVLASPDANLVSVRSWPEFIGEVSGYNYIDKTGRIPGAVFGNCGSDAYHMENYRNPDMTTRQYGLLEAMWREAGITADKYNVFYCGTGWRASEAWFNAYLLGWPRIAVYDGGWYEWSADPGNPVARGQP